MYDPWWCDRISYFGSEKILGCVNMTGLRATQTSGIPGRVLPEDINIRIGRHEGLSKDGSKIVSSGYAMCITFHMNS